ncbi:MAG: VWA domain-containing protein [Thermomicrobia bacterium]|nr:VWA domain-containing protein [Thermomicrobia bacterium]
MLGAGDGTEQLALTAKVNALALPGGHADFQDALGVLRPLLNPQQRNEVVVITDGGLLGTGALSSDDKLPASIRVEDVTQGENPAATANVAITQAATRVSQTSTDQEEFFTRIANYAATPATVTLRPSFNDIASAEEPVTIAPGQTIERTYTMPKGTTKARLEARTPQPDAFPADNVAEVVARGGSGSRAVLITTQPGTDTPLIRALKSSPNIKLEIHDAAEKPDLATLGGSFLVLVGALARPLLNVGFLRPSGGARQLFIVLNGGSSMGATDIAPTRFARAKAQAASLIGGLAPDETATVMVLGSEVRMLGAGDGTEEPRLPSQHRPDADSLRRNRNPRHVSGRLYGWGQGPPDRRLHRQCRRRFGVRSAARPHD